MKRTLLAAGAALTLFAGMAQAATFTATRDTGSVVFTIDFEDDNGDRLLGFTEVDSFSGIATSFPGGDFDELLFIPVLAGFTSDTDCGEKCGNRWGFLRSSDGMKTSSSGGWNYSITGLSAVPLPASLPLLLVSLGAFGLNRRKR